MSQTISFGQGGFTLDETTGSGTENIEVIEQGGKFQLFNDDGSTIIGLGLATAEGDQKLTIGNVEDDIKFAIKQGNISLTGDNNRLSIQGSARNNQVNLGDGSGNKLIVDGKFRSGEINASGQATLRFKGENITGRVARGTTINLGEEDDLVVFGGNISNVNVNDLGGNNTFRFKGNIRDTTLKLTRGDSANKIRIQEDASLNNFRIRGADEDDVLFIGSSEYQFEGSRTWVNVDDSDDFIRL
jgi:hypothetical protein